MERRRTRAKVEGMLWMPVQGQRHALARSLGRRGDKPLGESPFSAGGVTKLAATAAQ